MTNDQLNANEPKVTENPIEDSKSSIPLWFGLGLLLATLILAGFIISQISGPLADLLFNENPEVPIPEGATLVSETEGGSATREWLYHINQPGCSVVEFYSKQENVKCSFGVLACVDNNPISDPTDVRQIGSCLFTETDNISGYSWRVDITENNENGRIWTSFRVYLYDR